MSSSELVPSEDKELPDLRSLVLTALDSTAQKLPAGFVDNLTQAVHERIAAEIGRRITEGQPQERLDALYALAEAGDDRGLRALAAEWNPELNSMTEEVTSEVLASLKPNFVLLERILS